MRRITVAVAALSVAGAAAGVTAAVAGTPSTASPQAGPVAVQPMPVASGSCGRFEGTGPAPGCSYRVSTGGLRVELRNTAPVPIRCTLGPNSVQKSSNGRDLAPGGTGVLSWPISGSAPHIFEIDCRSIIPVGHVARHTVLTVSGQDRSTAPRHTPSSTKRSTPSMSSSSTRRVPSTTTSRRTTATTTATQTSRPTGSPTTTTPPVVTTTTTTTPVR